MYGVSTACDNLGKKKSLSSERKSSRQKEDQKSEKVKGKWDK